MESSGNRPVLDAGPALLPGNPVLRVVKIRDYEGVEVES
jgi:hypothetical protein